MLQMSFLESKADYFHNHPKIKDKKIWYNANGYIADISIFWRQVRFLKKIKIPAGLKLLDVLRWLIADLLNGKERKKSGVYLFVGAQGEGKTISMIAQMERSRLADPTLYIATNFNYKFQDEQIDDWIGIIKVAVQSVKDKRPALIAVDELPVWFEATDWQQFPKPLKDLLKFVRKYNLQLLFSSQDYDFIPAPIRKQGKYTVIAKNIGDFDRYFKNYYFNTKDYEKGFNGKRAKCDFVRSFVASDYLYNLYDTKKVIDKIATDAKKEKTKKQEAFELLFGGEPESHAPDS